MCNTEDIEQHGTLAYDLYYLLFNATLSSSPIFSPVLSTKDIPVSSGHLFPGTYESNYSINSTGNISFGDTTQLKAITSIKLQPGFESSQGSLFKAKVNNCD